MGGNPITHPATIKLRPTWRQRNWRSCTSRLAADKVQPGRAFIPAGHDAAPVTEGWRRRPNDCAWSLRASPSTGPEFMHRVCESLKPTNNDTDQKLVCQKVPSSDERPLISERAVFEECWLSLPGFVTPPKCRGREFAKSQHCHSA